MKFGKIKIQDFRQYYKTLDIDLSTDGQKNIVLFGGKNGFGKTNFLLSIVWCLYGERISQIDENFKKEIQKEKNYSSFMQQSLNWTSRKEGRTTFSIEIHITGVELPSQNNPQSYQGSVVISRKFDVSSMSEVLSIKDANSNLEIFQDEGEKIAYINDFLIPIDAAKFVFFDAEKISEIANLSIKDEGGFINDALAKILGLDVYESLIDDIEIYINGLKKEGASKNLQEQIVTNEKGVALFQEQILVLEEENAENHKEIDELKKRIREFDNLISQYSKKGSSVFDRDSIISHKSNLEEREKELLEAFNNLAEIIPLALLSGKLEEVAEHLGLQDNLEINRNNSEESIEKIEQFIELLFNRPPEPENSTLSFKDKLFYYEKASRLSKDLFGLSGNDSQDLLFEHDLNNAEKRMIHETIQVVNTQSKEFIESSIQEYNNVKSQLAELTHTLNKIDADLNDELVLEYASKRETADFQISERYRKIGENTNKISDLQTQIGRMKQQLVQLVKKVSINDLNKRKIKKSQDYIDALTSFLDQQKILHKASLEANVLSELKRLMHKLKSETNNKRFIEGVKVTILAAGQGMKITLFDQDDLEIRKESLSSGEKQIYISCLIKAILTESVKKLPIFIDTPLGRLDEEHRDSLTSKYYPTLSDQVILFSTNSEITPKRFKDIQANISHSYILVNDGVNTKVNDGYFNIIGND